MKFWCMNQLCKCVFSLFLSKNEIIHIPDSCTKTPSFLDRYCSFNGGEKQVWCRLNVAVFEYWFALGHYGDGDDVWFVFVMLCNAFDFSSSKIWEKLLILWLKNYYLKALEIIIFEFQICSTNIYWDNRCFMSWGFYCDPSHVFDNYHPRTPHSTLLEKQ